jgi:hypothetical protein
MRKKRGAVVATHYGRTAAQILSFSKRDALGRVLYMIDSDIIMRARRDKDGNLVLCGNGCQSTILKMDQDATELYEEILGE